MPKSLKLLNPNDIDSELTYSACFMLRKIQRTRIGMLEPKSFYLSPAVGYFYECNAQHAHLGGHGVITKEIQIILRSFLVIAMYCQASSSNHSTSHVASWLGRKPRYMQ